MVQLYTTKESGLMPHQDLGQEGFRPTLGSDLKSLAKMRFLNVKRSFELYVSVQF